MNSKFDGMGYLYADDRASGGPLTEADVWTCSHCQKILVRTGWAADGGWCGRCMQPVCGSCADKMTTQGCMPFKRLIDEALDKLYHHQQLMRALGV